MMPIQVFQWQKRVGPPGPNHKYAAQIAAHARAVERHKRKLVRLHAKIKFEAVAIAGPDYDEHHAVSLKETASLDEQLLDSSRY